MGRAPCCDKANVKRGPWSPEEDATLRNYVQTHGIGGNWIALPRKAGIFSHFSLSFLNFLIIEENHAQGLFLKSRIISRICHCTENIFLVFKPEFSVPVLHSCALSLIPNKQKENWKKGFFHNSN